MKKIKVHKEIECKTRNTVTEYRKIKCRSNRSVRFLFSQNLSGLFVGFQKTKQRNYLKNAYEKCPSSPSFMKTPMMVSAL